MGYYEWQYEKACDDAVARVEADLEAGVITADEAEEILEQEFEELYDGYVSACEDARDAAYEDRMFDD